MAAYAAKGIDDIGEAQRLAFDYFAMDKDDFMKGGCRVEAQSSGGRRHHNLMRTSSKHSATRRRNRLSATTASKLMSLSSQVRVPARPASWCMRVAYLVRIKREDPNGILVLSYNRLAAAEIRERLRRLIGDDARFVMVLTIHALPMRLVGASFAGRQGAETPDFDTLLADATRVLRGYGLGRVEAEVMRETLIQGYRWILVDEYQDVGPEEYGLLAAVAGRSIDDPELRISLSAVGDDDQNIYAFAGASVRHIRQFEGDYSAKPVFLTDNYRSSQNIITAANAVIEGSRERMKTGHGITVDRSRRKERPGGVMERLDRVARGRVQILCCPSGNDAQALAALNEMIRLSGLVPDWSWKRAAIISRDRQKLLPVRGFAEAHGIPVEMANENLPGVWRKREMQAFIGALREGHGRMVTLGALTDILNAIPASRWTDRIGEGIGQLARETDGKALPSTDLIEWFAEWSRDTWGELRGLKLLTAHRAKGLEFDDVVILDGGWEKPSRNENEDAPRQLFFVAMTRAHRNLIVMSNDNHEYLPTQPQLS